MSAMPPKEITVPGGTYKIKIEGRALWIYQWAMKALKNQLANQAWWNRLEGMPTQQLEETVKHAEPLNIKFTPMTKEEFDKQDNVTVSGEQKKDG